MMLAALLAFAVTRFGRATGPPDPDFPLQRRRAAAHQADDGRDGEQNDGDEEDELRGFHGGAGDAAESEQSSHEGDDEESNGPAKHLTLSFERSGAASGCDLIAPITPSFRPGSGVFRPGATPSEDSSSWANDEERSVAGRGAAKEARRP